MINVIIILILSVTIAGTMMFASVTLQDANRVYYETEITMQRLRHTAQLLRGSLRSVSGVVRAPSGTNGSDYMQVPTWISTTAYNANGVPFLYCPYSISTVAGSAATVNLPGASTYAIETTTAAITNNRAYVYTSPSLPAAAPSNTVGILVAALGQNDTPPDCTAITSSSNAVRATGGAVELIQTTTAPYFATQSANPTAVELYVGTSASGDGSGRDTANYITLANAMTLWRTLQPRSLILNLQSGTHTGSAVIFASTGVETGNPRGLKLTLRGLGAAVSDTTINGTFTMTLGTDYQLENLTLGSGVTLTHAWPHQLWLHNVTLPLLNCNTRCESSGTLTVNSTMITVDNHGAFRNNGALSITTSNASGYGVYLINQSSFVSTTGSSITVNSSVNSGYHLLGFYPGYKITGATIAMTGSNTTQGIGYGHFEIDNSTITTTRATQEALFAQYLDNISLNNVSMQRSGAGTIAAGAAGNTGAEVYLNNVTLGSSALPLSRGFLDSAGATRIIRVGGSNTNIWASTGCWAGTAPYVMSRSAAGTPGSNNSSTANPGNGTATYDYLYIDNRSSWTCR